MKTIEWTKDGYSIDGKNSMLFAMNLFSSPQETELQVRQNDGTTLEIHHQQFAPMEVKTFVRDREHGNHERNTARGDTGCGRK